MVPIIGLRFDFCNTDHCIFSFTCVYLRSHIYMPQLKAVMTMMSESPHRVFEKMKNEIYLLNLQLPATPGGSHFK